MILDAQRSLRGFASRRHLRVRRCLQIYLDPTDVAVAEVHFRHGNRRYSLLASTRVQGLKAMFLRG
jgi:hypothetical protein